MNNNNCLRVFGRILLVWMVGLTVAYGQNNPDRKEWIQLFNGKDLKDWAVKITGYDLDDNFGNTFRVENGLFKVSYDQYDEFGGRFGHIFYRQKFSHYIVAVEYRFVGEQVPGGPEWALRNSGIMVHSQSPESMQKDQDFPICIEVQLLGGSGSGERSTANLCTPGTNVVRDGKLFTTHCLNSSSKTYHGDQWVRVEAMVLGDSTKNTSQHPPCPRQSDFERFAVPCHAALHRAAWCSLAIVRRPCPCPTMFVVGHRNARYTPSL